MDSLLSQYKSWLLVASSQGGGAPDTDLMETVRRRILEDPDLHTALHNDAFSLIAEGLRDQSDLLSSLNRMAGAFQALEQAALHLYFTPWRKEFHTIKTYSGHYIHLLEPAFSQDGIFLSLGKLGYEAQEGGACLTLRSPPLAHALCTAALGFLAGQLECRILADIVLMSGPELVNGADLIRERKTWRGEAACMERLQKLIQEVPKSPPTVRGEAACMERLQKLVQEVPKSPPTVEVPKSCDSNQVGEELYRPKFCDHCHETWDQHVNGRCRERNGRKGELLPHGEDAGYAFRAQAELTMHDCVYADGSLEQCCAECRLLHSSSCPRLAVCKSSSHPVTQLTPLKKREAVMQEEGKKYTLHICLEPGKLPHYRCAQCRELHYINCKQLEQCRGNRHSAQMIMLEKDQRLWLRRSLMDLNRLCVEGGRGSDTLLVSPGNQSG